MSGSQRNRFDLGDFERIQKLERKERRTSGKYFSRIRLLRVDLIHQSCRSHIPSFGTALIYSNLLRVINFFQINSNDQCDLISTDQLKLLYSTCVILYCSFQSMCASTYDRSTCTSSLLSSNLLYQLLIRFHNLFHFK